MSMDLTGITNKNEYYTNHYFSTVFEENTRATISGWNAAARESEEIKTPWSLLRQNARQYYTAHDKFVRSSVNLQVLANIKALVGNYLKSLGYPEAKPEVVAVDDSLSVPVYLEMTKSNGAPLLWVLLSASKESDAGIMESFVFNANDVDDDAAGTLYKGVLGEIANEDLVTKILFGTAEPPRFVMLIGMNQIALIDRNKWNEKRYLQFELEEIFSRLENTTLQAMSVLLHKDSLCPDDGKVLLDELDEQSQKNASGVSQDLKYALRESIELLGNEVLYDMKARLGRDLDADPVDAGQLTLECLRYMYRMLFVLFIESRPELGYAPIKAQSYYSGYSLESLRDIADNIRDDVNEVGDGYAKSIVECYEGDAAAPIPGIKDEDGDWNVKGHPDRVIHVTKKELAVFAKLFDGNDNWKQAKLPQLHAKQLIETLECFADSQITVGSLEQKVFTTTMWEETSSQDKGLTKRDVHFPESTDTLIYSGPHIGVANPLFKTSRRICRLNSDYDNLDLLEVDSHYLQRCNYIPVGSPSEYCNQIPKTIDGHYYTDDYRVVMRKMLNQGGERTLIAAIIPPKTKHIDGIFGITIEDVLLLGAFMASIPYDFLIKAGGKAKDIILKNRVLESYKQEENDDGY